MYLNKEEIIKRLQALPQERLGDRLIIDKADKAKKTKTSSDKAGKDGLVFDICKVPPEIRREVEMYESRGDDQLSMHNKKWVETVKAMPTKTSRFPKLDKDYLDLAQEYWKEQISGLEDIYEKLLLHIVRYLRTGMTRPIIMVGAPGCGKTRVMLTLGEILDMPVHFANAVQMAKGNGLSGSSKMYVSSAPGEPVEAMVRHRRGNLIFAIDEIDKAALYAGRGGDLQDELLNLTSDETARYHKDNFLGFTVDTSHLFIIMTANDLSNISEPLKSRCDVIEFPEPTREMIAEIMVKHTIPKMLDALKCRENVRVDGRAVSEMVMTLFSSGLRDIRKYQGITENVINSAFLKSLRTASTVEVSFEELTRAANKQLNTGKRSIGF